MARLYDEACRAEITASIHRTVPWYIMAARAYYVDDAPILSDAAYDSMARTMKEHWDDIAHPHKAYLDYESVAAQTYLGEYPRLAVEALNHLKRHGVTSLHSSNG